MTGYPASAASATFDMCILMICLSCVQGVVNIISIPISPFIGRLYDTRGHRLTVLFVSTLLLAAAIGYLIGEWPGCAWVFAVVLGECVSVRVRVRMSE